MLAHAVGGLATATLGTVTKSRLDDLTSSAAKPAIAKLILEQGLEDAPALAESVAKVQKDYQVDEDDFRAYRCEIYKLYLLGMCQNPMAKTSELKELSSLKRALSLDNLDLGAAHADAAAELYRQIGLYTPEEELDDEGHPDRMKIDKCLFLSERAFRSADETDEAFNFEMGRVAKAFKLSTELASERIVEVAEPFYRRALGSTRAKLMSGKVNRDMLMRARESLGIQDSLKNDLHSECYAEEVKAQLTESGFQEGSVERLRTLQDILELSDDDAAYERSVECTPMFQQTLGTALESVVEQPETAAEAWVTVERKQQDLCLSKDGMMPLLDSLVVQTLGKPLEDASNFLNVGNKKQAIATLEQALKIKDAVFNLLQQGQLTDLSSRYLDPTSASSANGFATPTDRQRLYNTMLAEYLAQGDNNLTPENLETMAGVAQYLGLSDYEVSEASRAVCGPLVETALKAAALEITGDDFTETLAENLKIRTDKLIADLGVSEDLVKEYGRNVFRDAMKVMALKCPNGIPSEDQKKQLTSLADLLTLTSDDVAPFYVQTFGKVYKKSVLESMGSTGIILPEYREALDKLRGRLGIPEGDEKALFLSAAGERIKPMVQLLANEMERTMLTKEQLSQKRGMDMGQDVFKGGASAQGTTLGIYQQDTLTSDTLVLIDFYKENDLIVTDDETNSTTYPLTAISLSAIEPEMAEALYRQFVVSGFATQDTEKQTRIENDTPTYGGILGLKPEHQDAVRKSIAGLIYENYIKNALTTKPALDQQDMMFLANIQMKLDVSSDKSEEMMLETQKKILFDDANALFDRGVTGDGARAYREKCAGLGMELLSDVNLPRDRVESLFKVEVGEGISSGAITLDDTSLLQEIQESVGLDVEDAEKALGDLVSGVCQNVLDKVNRELMRGREENCVEELRRMLMFLKLTGGEVGDLLLPEGEVNKKILMIYQNSEGSDEEGAELLKNALDLESE
jgi:hypothetical protein